MVNSERNAPVERAFDARCPGWREPTLANQADVSTDAKR
jgi:hypothetical protein